MKKYTEKEVKQIFESLGLPVDKEVKLYPNMLEQKRNKPRVIINAGTSSKFVYSG